MTQSITVVLKEFSKIDEGDGIHLWESRLDPPFTDYSWMIVDPDTFEDVFYTESQFKEAVYQTFKDISPEKNIMCGVNFVAKPFYFVRLFLTDEQEGHFIVKHSGQRAEVVMNGFDIESDLRVEIY